MIVKALFVFKYLNLCPEFFGHVGKRLDKKAKVISNIYDVTARSTVTINILSNISRSKGIQTMKFGQLVKYNIRTFFLKNHTYNVVEKLVPDHFSKISKLQVEHISRFTIWSFIQFVYCMYKWKTIKIQLKLRCKPSPTVKIFQNKKRRFGTSLLASYSASYLKKNISHVMFC